MQRYFNITMTKMVLSLLKLLIILIFAGWICLWVLKPTQFWTQKWKSEEEKASASVFGYNGLDFVVYTCPVIAFAITGYIYLGLKQREPRNRQGRRKLGYFSSPFIVNKYIGVLSGIQILCSSLFIIFLIWTFYARVSNDFKKMTPIKSFKLSLWQYKLLRIATRCGLLAEACLALLLLPVLRGMSIFRVLGIQFEASVRYHIWLGTSMMLFATLHGLGTFFIWGINHRIQDEMWKWQKKGRIYLAGEIVLLTGLVIWITSLPQIRRKWFEVFYYTHHLYIPFLVFFLFHGGDRHFYMVFPGVLLFALDKLLRIIQSRPETCILSARLFPCNAVELTFPKDPRLKYTPTSVIFLKVPSISKFQWHPFSITSSSSVDEHTISIVVKSEGQWTSSLYEKIVRAEVDSEEDQRECIPVALEGPYGPVALDFLRYDNLLLVAGGIGVTPFLSILKEISCNLSNTKNGYPKSIQLIYTIKNSQDICLLSPILPQLLDTKQYNIKLKVFVTRENQIGTTLKELLNNTPQTRTTNFSTKSTNYATYGSERLEWTAVITSVSSVTFLLSLVCFNHFMISSDKKQKNPSSVVDILLMCSFVIAIIFGTLTTIMIRRKRLKKGLRLFSEKTVKKIIPETSTDHDEHEIHFGGRPNFQDIFTDPASKFQGSDIGVFVCGPDAMKECVASACVLSSQRNSQEKKPHFSFHSLNFTL